MLWTVTKEREFGITAPVRKALCAIAGVEILFLKST